MANRKLTSITMRHYEARVYRDADLGEYLVKFYRNGTHKQSADYHTDDRADAFGTALIELRQMNSEGTERPHGIELDRKPGHVTINLIQGQLAAIFNLVNEHATDTRAMLRAMRDIAALARQDARYAASQGNAVHLERFTTRAQYADLVAAYLECQV